MRSPSTLLALLLTGAVLAVAVTPCLPAEVAGDARAELAMKAKCPCSCSDAGDATNTTTHLDFALERAAACAPALPALRAVVATSQRLPGAPPLTPDVIPI